MDLRAEIGKMLYFDRRRYRDDLTDYERKEAASIVEEQIQKIEAHLAEAKQQPAQARFLGGVYGGITIKDITNWIPTYQDDGELKKVKVWLRDNGVVEILGPDAGGEFLEAIKPYTVGGGE